VESNKGSEIIGVIVTITGILRMCVFFLIFSIFWGGMESTEIIYMKFIIILYLGLGSLILILAGVVIFHNIIIGRILFFTAFFYLIITGYVTSVIYLTYSELIFYILLTPFLFLNFRKE
jgi:hypothetical protein